MHLASIDNAQVITEIFSVFPFPVKELIKWKDSTKTKSSFSTIIVKGQKLLKSSNFYICQDQKQLEEHIESIGLGHEHFWTSGTDQGEEGQFVWMSSGKPLGWENWNAGEPNNYE